MRGFKNFLMRGDVIVVAVGLVIALAFSALITSHLPPTSSIRSSHSSTGGKAIGLGFQIRSGNPKTFVDIGAFISAVIYFVIFMAMIYFLIVVPYKHSPGAARASGIRRPGAGQDVPGVPVH